MRNLYLSLRCKQFHILNLYAAFLPRNLPRSYSKIPAMAESNNHMPISDLPSGLHEYVIHFAQAHETFRKPELESLAKAHNIDLQILTYAENIPFAKVALKSNEDAKILISRSILIKSIYELWGYASSYESLHKEVKRKTSHIWNNYKTCSFKFAFESFQNYHKAKVQRQIIETFSYVGFDGPIIMTNPDETFTLLENYIKVDDFNNLSEEQKKFEVNNPKPLDEPHEIYLGRLLGKGNRYAAEIYDLKKRNYIGTTSMDAELALITANCALAGPGKLVFDPFVGTGSFSVACAAFGALTFGSDIDGRMIRGNQPGKTLRSNYEQYSLMPWFGDMFTSDLTNSPIGRFCGEGTARSDQIFDAIICDPPYGVREGLKVLGSRDPKRPKEIAIKDGVPQHLLPDYVPPKRPYSFHAMLEDILNFASNHLVPEGRLCIWLPTADDEFSELAIPTHPNLKLEHVAVQNFNKWSRRLLTYSRNISDEAKQKEGNISRKLEETKEMLGKTADALNPFRKKYFEGFKATRSEGADLD